MPSDQTTPRDAIAHCLLMGRGAYETPEAWAEAVLKRLDHEGYCVVRKEPDDPWNALAGDNRQCLTKRHLCEGLRFPSRLERPLTRS